MNNAMKKIMLFIVSLMMVSTLSAQTYEALWAQVEQAQEKDQPKTALSIIGKIRQKAQKEHSYGNLLAAYFAELNQQNEISGDSLEAAKTRLKNYETQLKSKDVTAYWMCHIALAIQNREALPDGLVDTLLTKYNQKGDFTRIDEALKYTPLIKKGADSKYFNNDLISIIGMKTRDYKGLIKVYEEQGNTQAVNILKINDAKIDYDNLYDAKQRIAFIDSMIALYPNEREIRYFKMARLDETYPTAHLHSNYNFTPSKEQKIYFTNVRNIREVVIKVTPKGAGKAVTVKHRFPEHKDYETFNDTVSIGKLAIGHYVLTVTYDGKKPFDDGILEFGVSDLKIIAMQQGVNKTRLVVVNATTGRPVPNAKLEFHPDNKGSIRYFTTDNKGEYIFTGELRNYTIYAKTATDKYMDGLNIYRSFAGSGSASGITQMEALYTDRSIYRPGQKVQVAVIAQDLINGKETKARSGCNLALKIQDSKWKSIETLNVTTDEYGTATAEFTLPEHGNNGTYTIRTSHGGTTFRVEEYVRPTFDITLDKPTTDYKVGDTLTITGHAKTYSGVGVGNSQVVYNVTRGGSWWWRNDIGEDRLLNDTVTTAPDGTFTMRMPMTKGKNSSNYRYFFYNIRLEATVTNLAGESHTQVLTLPVSNRSSYLSSDMKELYLADSLMSITLTRRNAAGKEIEGRISVYIDDNKSFTVDANKQFNLSEKLISGKHSFKAICAEDTLEQDFYVFRLTDKRPIVNVPDWWYQSSNTFANDDDDNGKNAPIVQFGTAARNAYAVYSLFSGNKLIESGSVEMDSSLVNRKFVYKPEYGDGVCYTIIWVRDGNAYTHHAVIKRALPDKKLSLTWSTFRNKLQPGQAEEWQLKITDSKGKPAVSQLTAVLYDKSLDAIYPHKWNFWDIRSISQPSYYWQYSTSNALFQGYDGTDNTPGYKPLDLSVFNPKYTNPLRFSRDEMRFGTQKGIQYTRLEEVNLQGRISGLSSRAMMKLAAPAAANGAMEEMAVGMATTDEAEAPAPDAENIAVRSALGETAFFQPRLLSDENGISTISFTLPESVTTWRFMALAHDKNMRVGTLTDEVVAQKKLMIQPLMPRFIYETDKASISANVSNISENDMNVTTCMTILNQKTEKSLYTSRQDVFVKAGESQAVTFKIDASNYGEGTYIVKLTAQNTSTKDGMSGESDGEQHLLPILSTKVSVENTKPLVINKKGTTTIPIADMLPQDVKDGTLSLTYIDQPAWYLIDALPYTKVNTDNNAITLAAALYTNTLAAHIVSNNPDATTKYDKADLEYRARDILTQLSMLQLSNGSWPWWRGMYGSRYITVEVVQMLLRLNKLVGKQDNTETLITRAFRYLDSEAEQDVKDMKKSKTKSYEPSLSGWHNDYLYAMSLAGRKNNTQAYLLNLLKKEMKQRPDMATKAQAAITFALNNEPKAAQENIESILQHTVYREDVGRYFDSYRANYSWKDYRIPTQVWAIEALSHTDSPSAEGGKARKEMQRWLLSSKRTQEWDSPLNAVNAVYAFFDGDASDVKPTEPITTTQTITHDDKTIDVVKDTENESWAAVNVSFKQEISNVEDASAGFKVSRQIVGDATKVDNRVKVVITITADRDYDFVTVTDNRPACLEPVQQLSGYSNGAYTVQHDTNTEYCFDMFRKGKHTIETEYYVTRVGTYTTGSTTVRCTYAPEFSGRTTAEKLTVTNK